MKIFYADDDPDEIVLLCDILKNINPSAECITADNGEEALRILSCLSPDIIFLDINMPKLDGKECLKAIMEDSRLNRTPVIMYSSNDDKRLIHHYTDLGATWFLNKNSDIVELQKQLQLILDTIRKLPL